MSQPVKTDLLIVFLLLVVCATVWMRGDAAIDIQLHDSYVVLDRSFLIGLIIGPLAFSIFLIRAILRSFKSISANICLAMALVIVARITYYILQVQRDYRQELQTLEGIDVSARQRVIDNASTGIFWSWIVFGVCSVVFALLIFRTVRMWRIMSNR